MVTKTKSKGTEVLSYLENDVLYFHCAKIFVVVVVFSQYLTKLIRANEEKQFMAASLRNPVCL